MEELLAHRVFIAMLLVGVDQEETLNMRAKQRELWTLSISFMTCLGICQYLMKHQKVLENRFLRIISYRLSENLTQCLKVCHVIDM